MKVKKFTINSIPAIQYGETEGHGWLFLHGKCGCKEEAEAFAEIVCPLGDYVLSIDLPEHGERKCETGFDPWHVIPELRAVFSYMNTNNDGISIRANSIGAYFSMLALSDMPVKKALFVSPILDMQHLIENLMQWSGVTIERLTAEKEIKTDFGETLSLEYLNFVATHPIKVWNPATAILYGTNDNMTDRNTLDSFCDRYGCAKTIMENGEHWFHTSEQLEVLHSWETQNIH